MEHRYNIIDGHNKREIVLLKSYPCKYGKCAFCNYTEDNSLDLDEITRVNFTTLAKVQGIGVLEVINSGSVFELPMSTLNEIRRVAKEKNIDTLIFEVYFSYIDRIAEIQDFFQGIDVKFKMGIETFDNEFRAKVYNKHFTLDEKTLLNLSSQLYSICLLICTKGQTEEMIENDIEKGLKYFEHITINIFIDNGTKVESDPKLKTWFIEKYGYLVHNPRVDLLISNKDFGVFEQ